MSEKPTIYFEVVPLKMLVKIGYISAPQLYKLRDLGKIKFKYLLTTPCINMPELYAAMTEEPEVDEIVKKKKHKADDGFNLLCEALNFFYCLQLGGLGKIDELKEFCQNPKQFCDKIIWDSIKEYTGIGKIKMTQDQLFSLATPQHYSSCIAWVKGQDFSGVNWDNFIIDNKGMIREKQTI